MTSSKDSGAGTKPFAPIDRYDWKILQGLARDGRMTWRDLAEEIGLSLTPTIRRVRALEEAGYITGYFARLDEARLAGSTSVFVSVTLERQKSEVLDRFEEEVTGIAEVMSGYLMSGGTDYLLRCVVHDLHHYRGLLDRLTKVQGVAHIQSSFALKSFVNRSGPLLPKT